MNRFIWSRLWDFHKHSWGEWYKVTYSSWAYDEEQYEVRDCRECPCGAYQERFEDGTVITVNYREKE